MDAPLFQGMTGRSVAQNGHPTYGAPLMPQIQSTSRYVMNMNNSGIANTPAGLDRFFSAPRLHLTHAEMLMSSGQVVPGPFGDTRGISPIIGTGYQIGLSKPLLDRDGNRLPSVLKKALPLPAEDIRSVPHIRSPSPTEEGQTAPVVSIGMSDGEGVPIPWKQTPEMTAWIAASTKDLSKKPGYLAEQIREAMRADFESLENFIEHAFSEKKEAVAAK